jgi:putative ABC transport system permease protein
MLKDFFNLAIENITHRKVRSWLTILGIVVGIAAVVALVALGQGLQYTVDQQFIKIGSDKITINSKGSTGFGGSGSNNMLVEKDLETVRRTSGVFMAAERLVKTGKVQFNDKTKYLSIQGIPLDETRLIMDETQQYDPEIGRTLRQGDKNKILIGPELAKETTFGRAININDKLTINGEKFQVVGIIKTGGNPGVSGGIFMPIDDVRKLFDAPDEITMIMAKTDPGADIDTVIANIERELRKERGLKEGKEDFTVQSTKQFIESFLVIFNVVTVLLVGLASISLLVGAIGIANTMYTAVLERTKEIGIMKSIGAKNSDIMTIFLIEASLIGLLGGVVGVLIGTGIAKLAELIIAGFLGQGFFQVFLPWWLLLGAIAFAIIIGTLSGILPARQAAGMNPVDALRG